MSRLRSAHDHSTDRLDFEAVALAELPLLYRVAKRLTLDAAEAEDLVGQALLKATRAWAQFDGEHPRSWLIRILKNEHLNQVRKASVRPKEVEIGTSEIADKGMWEEVSCRAVVGDILEALDQLPEEYRLAVALCDVEEMNYEEAAAALSVPLGTIRSRVFRGRRILRERLGTMIEQGEC